MLDLRRMERITLAANPRFQKVVARLLLMPNYYAPPGVKITLEGTENLPRNEAVIYAMNHTDMYNYWPFQFRLWRELGRYTAAWVKGKYYENALMGRFMEACNTIPAVSRGYLITRDFISTMQRRPAPWEYRRMREAVEADADPLRDPDAPLDLDGIPRPILTLARNMLGRQFDPSVETWPQAVNALTARMNQRFVELNEECFAKNLDLIIFPQGTRSIALPRGHIGLSQVALRYRRTVVPVGCNGSDLCYNSSLPIARPGHIHFRIGKPLRYEDMAQWHIGEDFVPFTPEAEQRHRARFQGYVDFVMDRINELLDPRYQYSDDLQSDGVKDSARFV